MFVFQVHKYYKINFKIKKKNSELDNIQISSMSIIIIIIIIIINGKKY